MITNTILNLVLFLPKQLLTLLPTLNFSINFNQEYWNMFTSILSCVGYVLPIKVILLCIGIKLAFRFWYIPYAIMLRVKSFIPTMGH